MTEYYDYELDEYREVCTVCEDLQQRILTANLNLRRARTQSERERLKIVLDDAVTAQNLHQLKHN